jgi:hypothetical protein
MREPALGLKPSLLNSGLFLKRIHENIQSVWKLPWVPLPAPHLPIHLLDERRARTAPARTWARRCCTRSLVWLWYGWWHSRREV